MRASDLGIRIGELEPGRFDAITDVGGVRVGQTTVIEGDEVRTGVTVIVPPELPLFAGCHRLNGNGELTGLEWIRESGLLTTPIGITNTFSVGVVRDAIAAASADDDEWALPAAWRAQHGPQDSGVDREHPPGCDQARTLFSRSQSERQAIPSDAWGSARASG